MIPEKATATAVVSEAVMMQLSEKLGRMSYRKTTDEELALILEEGEGYTLEFSATS